MENAGVNVAEGLSAGGMGGSGLASTGASQHATGGHGALATIRSVGQLYPVTQRAVRLRVFSTGAADLLYGCANA